MIQLSIHVLVWVHFRLVFVSRSYKMHTFDLLKKDTDIWGIIMIACSLCCRDTNTLTLIPYDTTRWHWFKMWNKNRSILFDTCIWNALRREFRYSPCVRRNAGCAFFCYLVCSIWIPEAYWLSFGWFLPIIV